MMNMTITMNTTPADRLARLMAATRVAVVGASDDPAKLTGRPIAYMLKRGFKGQILPVNPSRSQVQGLKSYPSLAAIDGPVDLAIIGTAPAQVEPVVEEGIRCGIASFVVLSSGFAEHDAEGARLQTRLGALAQQHGIALVGPNCLGVINAHSGLIASFTTAMEGNALVPGGFGFVTQSGALGAYWLDLVLQSGLGVSRWITTGNECDIDIAAGLSMLVHDPDTRVIGAYVEDVKHGTAFRDALRDAARAGKPVFLIKAGRSAAGAAAAASHTGAIAGEDRIYQACFDQYGAVRVSSITELIDAAKLVLFDALPAAGQAGILSVSGGAGVLLADAIESAGLSLPRLTPDTAQELARCLPKYSKPQNPIDLTANVLSDPTMFRRTLAVVSSAPELDCAILFIGLMHSIADDLARAILSAREASGRPFVVVWIGAPPNVVTRLGAARIPVYGDIPQAVAALANVMRSAKARPMAREIPNAPPPAGPHPEACQLTEWRSKARLAGLGGLAIPAGVLVISPEEVAAALADIPGPYAAKLQSPQMLHKSDHGAVVLGLADVASATAATATLLEQGATAGVSCEGVLIEQMVPFDFELVAGLRRDPVFGAVLMVGRGGVEVELAPDVVMGFLPLGDDAIEAMLRGLRCARLFDGFRGRASVDLRAVARALAELCERFLSESRLEEIEINPLVLRGASAVALDALVKEAP
ncbi:acetate--CoA ligase family protein [Xanthobacter dioxanivorans]|uniref:Acetate--CoA ligase family protein n=1 Tax=Xanthobacter dioxanivorans TaxID=2528964 RepID=A0A974PT67_9HYPH|nr:acetate--CoA ligase family protein [Xanthobacter dioxanivorans]QRG09299.1 acetate--CoA ligase family protein [Xanthobacter dioxanivorans]